MKIDLTNKRTTLVHKTDLKSGKQQEITTIFDYSNCTDEEIAQALTKHAVIACRRFLRESTKEEADNQVIDVHDLMSSQRKSKSQSERLADLWAKMSDDEKAAFMEKAKK